MTAAVSGHYWQRESPTKGCPAAPQDGDARAVLEDGRRQREVRGPCPGEKAGSSSPEETFAVAAIQGPDGSKEVNDMQIVSMFHDFYQALYYPQQTDPDTAHQYLNRACMAKLSTQEKATLEA
ncbi:hypothetical protein NDU88_008275 [Pleurodeles waltl]|uniref:Uncharacterized protein n=1 Tax=Pleurodeles waltl TaxID=8319 RepID=A0AAV7VS27_PLEWA|nr:hypothetical protein NDU88_008275 [Pleurodeles waltl]